eukprot:gene15250-21332_t
MWLLAARDLIGRGLSMGSVPILWEAGWKDSIIRDVTGTARKQLLPSDEKFPSRARTSSPNSRDMRPVYSIELNRRFSLFTLLLLSASHHASSFYIPGSYPEEFKMGSQLQAKVNSLTSFDTELPFDYYDLPFCRPPEGVQKTGVLACSPDGFTQPLSKEDTENLKHKIDNHYRINMLLDNLPVTVYDLEDEEQEFVRPGFELGYKDSAGKYFINNHLSFNILVYRTHGEYTAAREQYDGDALVNGMDFRRQLSRKMGGSTREELSNLLTPYSATSAQAKFDTSRDFRNLLEETQPVAPPAIQPEPDSDGGGGAAAAAAPAAAPPAKDSAPDVFFMVVGFEVAPCSVARIPGNPIDTDLPFACGGTRDLVAQEIVEGQKLVFSYDVYWEDSDIKWASRWDAYLKMPGGDVQWFSIINSILVVIVMSSIVAMILVRTVRRDLAKYEEMMTDTSLDLQDEAGWKLLAGDVFRAPAFSKALAVQIGTGVQIISTATVTILLAALGFLSPALRGALISATIFFYVCTAALGGFATVYSWGLMERGYNSWIHPCFSVALFFPSIVISIFTILNIAIHKTGSTGAIPIGLGVGIIAIWFLISIPLTFAGGYLALRMPIAQPPVHRINQIPRQIPPPASLASHPAVLFTLSSISATLPVLIYFCYMTILILGVYYAMGAVGTIASYLFVYATFNAIKAD